jgi:hypothetical protein
LKDKVSLESRFEFIEMIVSLSSVPPASSFLGEWEPLMKLYHNEIQFVYAVKLFLTLENLKKRGMEVPSQKVNEFLTFLASQPSTIVPDLEQRQEINDKFVQLFGTVPQYKKEYTY